LTANDLEQYRGSNAYRRNNDISILTSEVTKAYARLSIIETSFYVVSRDLGYKDVFNSCKVV